MSAPPFYQEFPNTAKTIVATLANVVVGTDACGIQRQRVVTVLRPVFDDIQITHPTRRDVRVVMVAWGLPNAIAEQHAHVVAAMLRVDADVDEMMRS